MPSTWLPVRRTPPPAHITSVKCPRKGPIPNEISLLICGQMNDETPQRCAECKCRQAFTFRTQLEELRSMTRTTLRVFRDQLPVSEVHGELEGGEVV